MDKKSMQLETARAAFKAASETMRVSSISIALAVIVYAATVIGALLLEQAGFTDTQLGIFVTFMILLGLYLLFAIKVARQWEKAVVLRMGRFIGLRGPGSVLDHPDHRFGGEMDRLARHGHLIQRRKDPYA